MEGEKIYAICLLREDGNSGVSGVAKLSQAPGEKTLIEASIKGLSKGLHGFHIHQFGNLIEGCKSAGPHYNPFNQTPGGPEDEVRHVGDLGNIEQKSENKEDEATYRWEDQLVMLSGPNSVIGRSMVCHADPDDLGKGGFSDSLTTGHAGARLACGVIALSNKW